MDSGKYKADHEIQRKMGMAIQRYTIVGEVPIGNFLNIFTGNPEDLSLTYIIILKYMSSIIPYGWHKITATKKFSELNKL